MSNLQCPLCGMIGERWYLGPGGIPTGSCVNKNCFLPVNLWPQIEQIKVHRDRLKREAVDLDTKVIEQTREIERLKRELYKPDTEASEIPKDNH